MALDQTSSLTRVEFIKKGQGGVQQRSRRLTTMTETTKSGLSRQTKAWVAALAAPLLAVVIDVFTYVPLFYLVAYLLPVRLGRDLQERKLMLVVCALICMTGTVAFVLRHDQVFLFQRGASLAGQLMVFVASYYLFLRQSRIETETLRCAEVCCRLLAKL